MKSLMTRGATLSILMLLLAAIAPSIGTAQQSSTLTVTYEVAEQSLPFLVALERGLFDKHGVKVTARRLRGEALDFSDVDVVTGKGFDLLEGSGVTPTVIRFIHPFAMTKDGDMINGVLAKKSARISSWADFREKTVAVPAEWMYNGPLRDAFRANGQVQLAERLGTGSGGIKALEVGGVDRFGTAAGADVLFSWGEDVKRYLALQPARYDLFAKNLQAQVVTDPYFVGASFVNMAKFGRKTAEFKAFTAAVDEAIDLVRQSPSDALALLPKHSRYSAAVAARVGLHHFFKSTEQLPVESLEKSTGDSVSNIARFRLAVD